MKKNEIKETMNEKMIDILTFFSGVDESYIKEAAPKETKQLQNRTVSWRKWGAIAGSAAAACLCLVVASSVLNGRHRIPTPAPTYPNVPTPSNQKSGALTAAPAPTSSLANPTGADIVNPGSFVTGTENFLEAEGFTSWHGKDITFRLETVLEKPCDVKLIAICARPSSIDLNFSYNGKTIAAYGEEWGRLNDMPEKLQQLLKEGNALKYGETLYLTGTPDEERWSQELYEKRIEFYGSEIMSAYFADGEFLENKVLEDISSFWLDLDGDGYISTEDMEATCQQEPLPAGLKAIVEAKKAYEEAIYACLTERAASIAGAYPSKVNSSNQVIFYMTKDDFASFDGKDWGGFDLALKKDVDFTEGVIFLSDDLDDCAVE